MKSSRLAPGALLAFLSCIFVAPASRAATPGSRAHIAPGFYNNADGSPLVRLIRSATSRLDIEVYEMDDPQVIAAIRDALQRGVRIHIVKEPQPVGASCKVFENGDSRSPRNEPVSRSARSGAASCDDQRQLVDDVNQSGGSYVPFAKPELCGGGKRCLEHGKIVVADDRIALISSGNYNTTNLCDLDYSPRTCNRDYTYIDDNPSVIRSLQAVVETDMQGQSYDVESAIDPGARDKLTVGPDSLEPIVRFVQSARKSILIENQYLKEPNLNNALLQAARNGVDVKVIVSSACSFGEPRPYEKRQLTRIFTEFDNAGIETRMFNRNIRIDGEHGYLHAKAIVVDGTRAWMGSVNGSTQALTQNREFGIFFNDPTQVRKLSTVMSADFSNPNEESWQDSLDCAENVGPTFW